MCRVTFEFEINENSSRKHVIFSQTQGAPKWACLELTSVCNFQCKYCFINRDTPEESLSLSDIETLLVDLRELGFIQLSIIGGEPTLYPNFLDVATFASSLGFIVHVCSNGSRIDKYLARRMKEAGVDQVQINFDHVDIEKHNFLRGNKNSENCVSPIEALINCKETGMHTVMATVTMRENSSDVSQLMTVAYHYGFSAYRIWKRISKKRNDQNESDRCYAKAVTDCLKIAKNLGVRRIKSTSSLLADSISHHMKFVGCPAAKESICFSINGDVFPCSFFRKSIGNVRYESLLTVLERAKTNYHEFKGDLCSLLSML